MGRVATFALLAGVSLGRIVTIVLIAMVAVPVLATTPSEPVSPGPALAMEFSLTSEPVSRARERAERAAFPTDLPRVPTDDALRPPDLLWNPSPASLVKVVPAKVRYKLKF